MSTGGDLILTESVKYSYAIMTLFVKNHNNIYFLFYFFTLTGSMHAQFREH